MVQVFGLEAQTLFPSLIFQKGNAAISGKVLNAQQGEQLTLQVVVRSLFKEQPDFYRALVKKDGTFSLTVPMETNNGVCSMAFTGDDAPYLLGLVGLSQTTPTRLDITIKDGKMTSAQVSDFLSLPEKERLAVGEAIIRFDTPPHELRGIGSPAYEKSLQDYVKWQLDSILPQRVHYALEPFSFSPGLKSFLDNMLRIHYISGRMFFYKKDAEKYNKTVQEPPLSYYSFLRNMNLGQETNLYAVEYYPQFMSRFLKVPAFGIPPIADSPVKSWVESVKGKVEGTIGVQKLEFYNLLALYAYLNDNQTLSEQQKNNISAYYTGKLEGMGKALLGHYAVMDSIYGNAQSTLHINKTPETSASNVLNTILSRYAGKPVLVTLWGTWCQPCMLAHKEMSKLKPELRKKGIVFVYLADASSPKQTWMDKVKEIGDEHYYLTKEQVEAIFTHYKEVSQPYPFYLVFDEKHQLKQKFAGFSGADAIEQSLLK